ncbi:MAG: PAS domain S-box protein, partial [Thermodesulfobacteriota bacterium]|nr:PAS domain S-box protein [Thermodesulfobacteriota bacterium]
MTEKPTYEKLGQKDKLFSVPWRIYLKICIVGLIIISMFVYGFYKCHRMGRIYTPLIDAAIEIKLQAALAHLWLDEIISDDRQDYINKVWEHHDKAECYAKAMSEGGETPDRILMPIEDAEISGKLKSIRGKLKEFREVAKKRMGTKGTSGIGTDINRRYDHIFWSFLKEADEVETNFQQIMAKDFSRYMHTQIILIFITILLFLVSGIFFWHFDSQRVKNIILLNNANSALQKSEKNFAITFNSIGDAVISTDTEGNILQMNPVAEKLTGWNFSEARGCHLRAVFNIVNEETRQRVESPVKKVLHKGVAVKITNHTILIAKNGTEYSVEDSCAPIRDGYGTITGVVLVFRDVSEKRREAKKLRESEEKLIRSKKMESLGLLVSGVAHDLNNILSGIVGYPELMLTDLPEDSQLREPILAMQESGHRAVAVVQDLLTLARGVAITKKTLKLNDIVRDYLNSPEFEKLKQFHPLVTINSNLGNDLFNV